MFPRGFVTPKVGPHESYGFAPGRIYGEEARLVSQEGLVTCDNPNVEYIIAKNDKKTFVVLLNDLGEEVKAGIKINTGSVVKDMETGKKVDDRQVALAGYGIKVLMIQ